MKKQPPMKLFIIGILGIGNSVYSLVPASGLFLALFLVMVLDFLTGVYKAKMLNQARTSQGFRRTISKFVNYGVAILVSSVLVYLSQHKGGEAVKIIADYLGDALIIFIIYIEITSIFENLYKADSKSPISRYFFVPVLKFLTWQYKNNPVINATDLTEKPPKNEL